MCALSASVSDSATPWTAAPSAPLSMGLFQQQCWSGLPFSPPGDFPNPGIVTPTLAGRFFTAEPPGKPPGLCSLAAKYDPSKISLFSFTQLSPILCKPMD